MEQLLRVQTSVQDDLVVLRLCGELDVSTRDQIAAGLAPALERGEHAVVLDLSRLSFIDCAGASILVDARADACRHGVELALAAPSRPAARLLSLTRTGELVPVYRTVREAVNRYRRVSAATPRVGPPERSGRRRTRRGVPPPRPTTG